MKKMTDTDKKYFMLLTTKNISHTDLRTSDAQLLGKGCQYREEDSENKILS